MPPLSTLGMSGPISTLTGGGATGLVTENLVLNLVAFDTNSYSGSGSTWNDLSGQNYNGTINGASSSTVGNDGSGTGSFLFDGYNDNVECGNISGFTTNNEVTIENWVRFVSLTADDGDNSFVISGGAGSMSYQFTTRPGGYLRFWVGGSTGYVDSSSAASTNTWYHLVGTHDGSTMKFYINNSSQGTLSHSYTFPNYIVTDLGRYRFIPLGGSTPNSENQNQLAGYISVARVYQKALTASEVARNYNLDKSRYGY